MKKLVVCALCAAMVIPAMSVSVGVIIGQQQRGERQSDYQAYEAEECAPHRKGKKNQSRIQSHRFSHNLRCEEKVLNTLYNNIYCHAGPPYSPEIHIGINGVYDTQQSCRNKRYQLQIRYHVEHADEQAKNYGERKAHNKETYAE